MSAATSKDKPDNKQTTSPSAKMAALKNKIVSNSRTSDAPTTPLGNTTVSHSQNNTIKVRKDMHYMYASPATTDIPIFREEFLEHNKVLISRIVYVTGRGDIFDYDNYQYFFRDKMFTFNLF